MDNEVDRIEQILRSARTIAVVGLSGNPGRPSYGVASYLQAAGYRVIPVNPNYAEILGERCYPSLLDVPQVHRPDIVNVFRRSELVAPIVQQSIQIGAGGIWMQEGVADGKAAEEARQAGLWVIMDRCILKEHRRRV